jgi:hypothetical protein
MAGEDVTTSRFRARIAFTELEDIACRKEFGATYAGRLPRLASRRGHGAGDPRGAAAARAYRQRAHALLDYFKVVASHDLVDFIRAQAGDRRTGRGPSAGRSCCRTGLLPRLESGAPFRTSGLSLLFVGHDLTPPLRDHCGTSRSPVGHHCSIQCLKSALPRLASLHNALKRLVSQPQRGPSRPLPRPEKVQLDQ